MLLGQELKFKNKLCNLKLGTFFSALLGGIPVAMGLGYNYPALIGVAMALAGAVCLLVFHRKYE